MSDNEKSSKDKFLPEQNRAVADLFEDTLDKRHRAGRAWKVVFQISTIIGIIALATLILKIFNDTLGYAASMIT